MAKESFRFIHASDFHIERPMQDLLDLPDHLRSMLVEAPWKAAEAVFDHAVVENVDFVVLSGDLLNPVSTGATGVAFLLEQFEQLAQRQIPVYWAAGQADDSDRWPEAVSLPTNVHLFTKKQVESIPFRRNGVTLATVLGKSFDGRESIRGVEFGHEPDDKFVVAAAFGTADAETLVGEKVDYWALGGQHQYRSLQNESPHVRYCGSPQGRSMEETGAHGFYVVDVDGERRIQAHFIESDILRYSQQDVDAADLTVGRDLRQLLAKRVAKLHAESASRHLLIRWRIQMDMEQASVVGPSAVEELLAWLRREFGHGTPSAWSTEIEVVPPKQLPKKWYDEDTILGDFLRTAQNHRKTQGGEINLKPIVESETPGTPLWHSTLLVGDAAAQVAALERATLLGVDLLRGHQVDLLASTRRFNG